MLSQLAAQPVLERFAVASPPGDRRGPRRGGRCRRTGSRLRRGRVRRTPGCRRSTPAARPRRCRPRLRTRDGDPTPRVRARAMLVTLHGSRREHTTPPPRREVIVATLPRVDDTDGLRLFREALVRADYTADGLLRVLGGRAPARSSDGALWNLVRLLYLGAAVSPEEAADALAPLSLERLEALGVLEDGLPAIEIVPMGRVLVASDPERETRRGDRVPGPGKASGGYRRRDAQGGGRKGARPGLRLGCPGAVARRPHGGDRRHGHQPARARVHELQCGAERAGVDRRPARAACSSRSPASVSTWSSRTRRT